MANWNDKVKRLLKSELVKRGVSHAELADLLHNLGVKESKSSIDSKISRGSFSATFLIQCLIAIGCDKIEITSYETEILMAAEPESKYKIEA
ncbi:hypothetical protein BST97_10570 [Nonlabens spongiae]|uniref:DUF6471 domain-containing protein n=1 Tax=Nonlabens spongiae TaxID=331648 RepID=A0A1W6MLB8_9FLAO|nr:DUF6471 domain-containing protein [Nonlabens spongiae]ARN78393.1 hypothetical protein BST97_10570 [Nonlabens spongiae]